MASSNKIVIFCLLLTATLLIVVESGHNHGQSSQLATLIAAGLVAVLLREGAAGRSRAAALARHSHGLMVHPFYGGNFGGFAHPRSADAFGVQAFNFAPMFGGLRYNLGSLDNFMYPGIEASQLAADINPSLARNIGLFPPLPDMIANNKPGRLDNNFDALRPILHRERQHNPALPMDDRNGLPYGPDNRDFFNFHPDTKPHVEKRNH